MLKTTAVLFFITTLLASVLPAAPSVLAGQRAEVSPQVWAEIASSGESNFFLVLAPDTGKIAEQAAQTAAASGQDKVEAVFQALRSQAAQSQAGLAAYLAARGVSFQSFWLVNAIALKGGAGLVEELARRPEVRQIIPNPAMKFPEAAEAATTRKDSLAGGQIRNSQFEIVNSERWDNIGRVNAPALWSAGFTGQGIVYGIADTGVQWDHPALQGKYRGWDGSEANHSFNWWDAIHTADGWTPAAICPPDQAAPCDDYGHGTHALGIGVGDGGNGAQIGVAPGAKWIGCRNMYYGTGHPSTYIECLEFFIAPWDLSGNRTTADPAKHAHVISNSYSCTGSEGCPSDLLHQAVQGVRTAGIFMSVAAGNKGSSCGSVNDPPGLYPEVFSVGNTTNAPTNTISSSSSRGPATFGGNTYLKPELSAPGTSIYSSTRDNSYGFMSGTSMAAPHVAGAVALLWSAYAPLRGNIPATEALLKSSATPLFIPADACGDTPASWPNNTYGYGLLNIAQAYRQAVPNRLFIPAIAAP